MAVTVGSLFRFNQVEVHPALPGAASDSQPERALRLDAAPSGDLIFWSRNSLF
jgi:hypothetical protein